MALVQQNRSLSEDHPDGFFYQGTFFTDKDVAVARKGVSGNLHPSLVPEMTAYLTDVEEVRFDKERVRQALAIILQDVRTSQDLRDALPNQLAEMLEDTRRLERTRPEAYTVQDDPRKMKQYQKLREKVEYYSATRLIY